ncbi:hypothetical protein [Nostoc sp.]|uniref:hypothetical protein n=1 Tax=Nostoc sp. TaxID=1180 RepID=UPI002FF7B291
MPSISLDGFSTLKRDENFYLWLALRLAIEEMRGQWKQRHKEKQGETREKRETRGITMPNAQCPMPHAPCPMPMPNYRWSMGV